MPLFLFYAKGRTSEMGLLGGFDEVNGVVVVLL